MRYLLICCKKRSWWQTWARLMKFYEYHYHFVCLLGLSLSLVFLSLSVGFTIAWRKSIGSMARVSIRFNTFTNLYTVSANLENSVVVKSVPISTRPLNCSSHTNMLSKWAVHTVGFPQNRVQYWDVLSACTIARFAIIRLVFDAQSPAVAKSWRHRQELSLFRRVAVSTLELDDSIMAIMARSEKHQLNDFELQKPCSRHEIVINYPYYISYI